MTNRMITKRLYEELISNIEAQNIPHQIAYIILQKVDVSDWEEVELRCYKCKRWFITTTPRLGSPPVICPACGSKEEEGVSK